MNKKEKMILGGKMNNLLKSFFVLLSILVLTNALSANEEDELKNHFFEKLEQVKLVVQNKNQTKEKKYDDVILLLTPVFDFELMAKLSLGKTQWNTLSESDQRKFISIYTSRMKTSYSSKLDSYNDQKIKIVSLIRKKNRISLKTNLESDDKVLDIIYKFYKPKQEKENKDKWLIYDVEIVGVSILKADKAQFRDFLKTKNLDELMDALVAQN